MSAVGSGEGLTPLMRQFYAIKKQHPDKILFFRMGDFYEMFGDDAVKAAPLLGITLTSRSQGTSEKIPLAGVPYHSYEKYLARLLEKGEKVVIVEQVEDPKTAKGIVKREVVEIYTPGTATVEMAEDHRPMWLAALYENGASAAGIAALDLSTGDFVVDEGPRAEIIERLRVLEPSELLYPESDDTDEGASAPINDSNLRLTRLEAYNFDHAAAQRDLTRHFQTSTLDGFGVGGLQLAVTAAGAIFRYLKENHRDRLDHVHRLTRIDASEAMSLDYSTVRNLELLRSISTGEEKHSLFGVINRCHTPAGARRLKGSLLRPFRSRARIERRLSGVAELVGNRPFAEQIRSRTRQLGDLEKLSGRLGMGKLSPRQAAGIRDSLLVAMQLRELLTDAHSPHLSAIQGNMPDMQPVIDQLSAALVDEPPLTTARGGVFRRGFSEELDSLNDSIKGAREYIASLQGKERKRTGIGSLKVGFNKVFGYYLEITRTHADAVPSEYIRKQTLVNAERFITPELKEKEELIFSAEEKIIACEQRLYECMLDRLSERIGDLMLTAELLSELDLVTGLAELAVEQKYTRPEIHEGATLSIEQGRHPVIESVLPSGAFVANDTTIESDGYIHILTGPNMSGKSTYLRQIGLIVILAQIGSFVPAKRADIGLVDRVFTRVGALDNLARGQSTFLVEMIETANILHNATPQSLLLLDEVGRGTSTFDGLSVAWAVVEHLLEVNKSRTIFATHYHELTTMAETYDQVRNFQVAVREWEGEIVFLHQIIPGGCDDSYGIDVAKLAGVPNKTIRRAKQILRLLESGKFNRSELGKGLYKERVQGSLFDPQPSATEEKLRDIDVDNMTPMEALALLQQLKKELS